MKLIIDIDEKDYANIKDCPTDYEYSVALMAITSGIPYEPKGDLISREALRKAFEAVYPLSINEMGGVVNKRIYELIDNAPTVEPCYQTTSCLDCKNYDKETHNCSRYCEVIKEAIKSRPQGEWKGYIRSTFHGVDEWGEPIYRPVTVYNCTKCGRRTVIKENFCPNCGAEMQKGGKE